MKRSRQHTIDFLFPIALFFVFSATALIVLLLAANLYQGITTRSNASFEQETTLSYLAGKIRQNDSAGESRIYLTQFDSYDCLAIEQVFDEQTYITYIYEAEGELKELFLQAGVNASAASGTTLMQIRDLHMEEVSDNLFRFTCSSEDGSSDSLLISVNSEGGSYE